MMDTTPSIAVDSIDSEKHMQIQPIEYSVGEICKCFYNEIDKMDDVRASIVQTTYKCQGYCRVVEKTVKDYRTIYTVEVFEPVGERIKKLPGCCLRKTKVVPFTKEEAIKFIGTVVHSNSGEESMMIVSVSEYDGIVRINDINSKVMADDFVFTSNGQPCGKIVTLNADEVFG